MMRCALSHLLRRSQIDPATHPLVSITNHQSSRSGIMEPPSATTPAAAAGAAVLITGGNGTCRVPCAEWRRVCAWWRVAVDPRE